MRRTNLAGVLSLVVFCLLCSALLAEAKKGEFASAAGLTTDYRVNPLGIENRSPSFCWRMVATERGARQSGYQIQVASSEKLLLAGKPDQWDTGKAESAETLNIVYAGKPLRSRTAYFWRVRLWDGKGSAGAFSSPASFETAFLDPSEWQAKWVRVPSEVFAGKNGYHSEFAVKDDETKWVRIDLSEARRFDTIALYPARPYDWKRDEPGFGFPVRYRIETSDEPEFKSPKIIADRTDQDQPNPKTEPVKIAVGDQIARYLRLVATKLDHPKDAQGPLLALTELEVLDAQGKNLALGASVASLDSIESGSWSRPNLVDGLRVASRPKVVSTTSCGAGPMVRREFKVAKPVARARAYVTALGYYELHLNGKRVGDRVLDPANATFDKRVYYSTYDVTPLLRPGANCAAAMLGQGWWRSQPCFLLQLDITYADGATERLVSDDSWRWSPGPIVENSLYNGEVYDARKEQPGWDRPGFDDTAWQSVPLAPEQRPILTAQMIQPIKVVETLVPKAMTSPKPGVYVFDLGQNISGWCRLKVSGPAGAAVTLKHAEVLSPDGTVNQANLRAAKATEIYTLRGAKEEIYEPRFTYHGFRYVQVEGFPGAPTLDSIRGRVVHTALETRGKFACSNELLNQINSNSFWSIRANFMSIPTDCPQRDERQGWMADAHVVAPTAFYGLNMAPAYIKFLQDIADAQSEDGCVPDTVPHLWGSQCGDPMWSAAYHVILWETYQQTGDKQLLAKHYDGIRRYVDNLNKEAKNGVITRNNYGGDWVAAAGTPAENSVTGAFYQTAKIVADAAEVLGKSDDAAKYRALCGQIAEGINMRLYDAEAAHYGNGSQFSNAMPLLLGVVPPEWHQAVLDDTVRNILVDNKGHISSGLAGTRYVIQALEKEGRSDVIYTMATKEDYPSWGFMIRRGATTMWELWREETGNGMNSHNHAWAGSISEWFYNGLAGIQTDPKSPGWEHFDIKPSVVGDLTWAAAKFNGPRGAIASRWDRTPAGLRLAVTIPANTRATVFVPKAGAKHVTIKEGGATIWRDGQFAPATPGIGSGKDAGNWVQFDTGAGEYVFEVADAE